MIMALTIAVLVAGGVYLVMQRGMMRIVLGMSLISHAANIIILVAGVPAYRGEVFGDRTDVADMADPLPQAFVLTAIVITMATVTFMLALAALGLDDDTRNPTDPEAPAAWNTAGRKVRTNQSPRRSEKLKQRYERHLKDAEEND
ncbi:Na(+)/H(+) antiporter subunit C1 [Corynebacterium ciconiae DSM 44920]|uniref:sodium:proton antiporter n=1 Tax=Corynebacterium ciconiae TaxID=227319 RepID=UPI00036178F1|nr:cation:proton antiporter subunit C [Corynebacterium ciconiae]WKD62217.1 Na(+)/H(+) antiporter subunit C1 [Corynebacterium ciconiae DSM 44920]